MSDHSESGTTAGASGDDTNATPTVEPSGLRFKLYDGHDDRIQHEEATASMAKRDWMGVWGWLHFIYAGLAHFSQPSRACVHDRCEGLETLEEYFGKALDHWIYQRPFYVVNGATTQFGCLVSMPDEIGYHEIRLGGISRQRGLVYMVQGTPRQIDMILDQFLGSHALERAVTGPNGARLIGLPWKDPVM